MHSDITVVLKNVVEQFSSFLTVHDLVEDCDKEDIVGLLRYLSERIPSDVNGCLRNHSSVMISAAWYRTKYAGKLTEANRNASQAYSKHYLGYRERAYNEWTAKTMAESQQDVVAWSCHKDRLQSLVSCFETLLEVAKQRLSILEQLSNNYRVEVRNS